MAFLNANIKPIYCFIRKSYLYQLSENVGGFDECVIFAVCSIPGAATLFHCQLPNGAVYYRLPIGAFCHKQDAPTHPMDHLQLWNSFSYFVSVDSYDWLSTQRATVVFKDRTTHKGNYVVTFDWCNADSNLPVYTLAEEPAEHKCGHMIELDDGNYCIAPNNRILWQEPSFVVRQEIPDYDTNQDYPNVEAHEKWRLSTDNDKWWYKDVQDNNIPPSGHGEGTED